MLKFSGITSKYFLGTGVSLILSFSCARAENDLSFEFFVKSALAANGVYSTYIEKPKSNDIMDNSIDKLKLIISKQNDIIRDLEFIGFSVKKSVEESFKKKDLVQLDGFIKKLKYYQSVGKISWKDISSSVSEGNVLASKFGLYEDYVVFPFFAVAAGAQLSMLQLAGAKPAEILTAVAQQRRSLARWATLDVTLGANITLAERDDKVVVQSTRYEYWENEDIVIRPGDILESIDGYSVEFDGDFSVVDHFNNSNEIRKNIVIIRDGKKIQYSFKSEYFIKINDPLTKLEKDLYQEFDKLNEFIKLMNSFKGHDLLLAEVIDIVNNKSSGVSYAYRFDGIGKDRSVDSSYYTENINVCRPGKADKDGECWVSGRYGSYKDNTSFAYLAVSDDLGVSTGCLSRNMSDSNYIRQSRNVSISMANKKKKCLDDYFENIIRNHDEALKRVENLIELHDSIRSMIRHLDMIKLSLSR